MLRLLYEFFKTGLFSIGGGLATIPFLYKISDKTGWFSHSDLANLIAISESTPGAIGVNAATYVGFISHNFFGAVIATLGLILPSIIIITIISKVFYKFNENKYVGYAFYAMRPTSIALISVAFYNVCKTSFLTIENFKVSKKINEIIDVKYFLLALVIFIGIMKFKKIHPAVFIAFSAIAGILISII